MIAMNDYYFLDTESQKTSGLGRHVAMCKFHSNGPNRKHPYVVEIRLSCGINEHFHFDAEEVAANFHETVRRAMASAASGGGVSHG